MNKENPVKKKKFHLSFYNILLMFVIVPTITISLTLGIVLNSVTSKESEGQLKKSMTSLAAETGVVLDNMDWNEQSIDGIINDIDKSYLLGFDSAYLYVVDKTGIVLYHPDSSKKGNMITNDAVRGLTESLNSGKKLDSSGAIDYMYNGVEKTAAYCIGNKNYIAVITADKSDASKEAQKVAKVMIGTTIGMLILFCTLAFLLTKTIVKPLHKMVDITKRLADGDLSVDPNIKTKVKECASIRDSAIDLKTALNKSILAVKESTDELSNVISDVQIKTVTNADNVNQISTAVGEVAQTSQQVAQNVQNMTEQAVVLSSNIDMLESNIDHLQESANLIAENNNSATTQMNIVMDSSARSADAVKQITDKIDKTNAAIEEISKCVSVIEEISSQTNLLSLNASIEAARAGEAGKGFAVVAEEIRNLSDSTANSSQEIKTILENVIELSEETVRAAEDVANTTKEEQKNISSTQEKFTVLSDAVNESMQQILQIREMIEILGNVKKQLVEASENLGAISEELGASAEEVSASCNVVATSCSETQNRTEEMKNIDEKVVDVISFFDI